MPHTKASKLLSWMGMALTVSAFTSMLLGGALWIFEPHIESFIEHVHHKIEKENEHICVDFESKLGDEMGVRSELVTIEISDMFKEFDETKKNLKEFNKTWIPHLENEKRFFRVGYIVDLEIRKVNFQHFDGHLYPAWSDINGWYYMKEGYKFYK